MDAFETCDACGRSVPNRPGSAFYHVFWACPHAASGLRAELREQWASNRGPFVLMAVLAAAVGAGIAALLLGVRNG